MKRDSSVIKNDSISNISMILLLGFIIFQSFFLYNDLNKNQEDLSNEVKWMADVLERYELFDEQIDFSNIKGGVYFHDKYYSVWTGNKTEAEINREEIDSNEAHELSHHFVRQDTDHFCQGYFNRALKQTR